MLYAIYKIFMSKILGIDLGTTNCAMSIMEGGQPKILENAEGNRTTPSVVAISKNGERLVGQTAKRQSVTNPENTVYAVKRLIGRHFNDNEVQRDINTVPYKIVKSGEGVAVHMGDKDYSPQEVSAMILQDLKKTAEGWPLSEAPAAISSATFSFTANSKWQGRSFSAGASRASAISGVGEPG